MYFDVALVGLVCPLGVLGVLSVVGLVTRVALVALVVFAGLVAPALEPQPIEFSGGFSVPWRESQRVQFS